MADSTEGTTKPGVKLEAEFALELVGQFTRAFRPERRSNVPDNIPTACLLRGTPLAPDLSDLPVPDRTPAYVLFENSGDVYTCTIEQLRDYLKARDRWEDYDMCVFDLSLNWCIGISHEHKYTWVAGR